MSRSRSKAPIRKSNRGKLKRWRTAINKSLRRRNRAKLHADPDTEFAVPDDVGTMWDSPADGYFAAWDWFSERRKRPLRWAARRLAEMTDEERAEYERNERAREERLKRKLTNK